MSAASQATESLKPLCEKTKLCSFHMHGACRRGSMCSFAHSVEELRPNPDLTCTRFCAKMFMSGKCDRGAECKFAHTNEELRRMPFILEEESTAGCLPGGFKFPNEFRAPTGSWSHVLKAAGTMEGVPEKAQAALLKAIGMMPKDADDAVERQTSSSTACGSEREDWEISTPEHSPRRANKSVTFDLTEQTASFVPVSQMHWTTLPASLDTSGSESATDIVHPNIFPDACTTAAELLLFKKQVTPGCDMPKFDENFEETDGAGKSFPQSEQSTLSTYDDGRSEYSTWSPSDISGELREQFERAVTEHRDARNVVVKNTFIDVWRRHDSEDFAFETMRFAEAPF